MDRKIKDQTTREELPDAPALAEQDWEALDSDVLKPEHVPDNGDIRYEDGEEPSGELDEEDDDNPYQDSDEALPEDGEEEAIANDPAKEATRFGETARRR